MPTFLKAFFILITLKLMKQIYFPSNINVCKTFIDYYFPEGNDNCYHDPDGLLNTPQLIEKYAGTLEIHESTSEDGYISTMFRIPRANPKGVILLHHSIATYSHIYLFQGEESLAITLWRNGFDVWLANQRGTSYSDRHANMTKYDCAYWNFSFHEMGVYDISGELNLIREKTNNSRIIYFGHSLGASMGLVYASLKSVEANKYLRSMILISPATTWQSLPFAIRALKKIFIISKFFTDMLGRCSPFVEIAPFVSKSRIVIHLWPPIQMTTAFILWLVCGFTPRQTDPTFFSTDASMYFNNFSWKILSHFIQMEGSSDFKMYDYGVEENMKLYGKESAPHYPLENIIVPTLFVSSSSDTLVPQKDCENSFQKLAHEAKVYGHWKYTEFNHLDFLNGLHRKEIFTERLINFLKSVV